MEKISIEADLKVILPGLYEPVAIINLAGKLVGTYVPKLTEEDIRPVVVRVQHNIESETN